MIGAMGDTGYAAFSGILPASQVSTPPTSGSVVYDASFVVSAFVDVSQEGGQSTAVSGVGNNGDITLVADFADQTLTGATEQFEVDGLIGGSGSELGGTVRWLDIEGQRTGLIGSDQVVGAFHGSSDSVVFAGGLVGSATPPQN
ncbi:hypothetical protein [Yoonia sp. SS1-5]|uniref:Uncharacterized protein n=1 Tax=Yoonia rhodophyticola TaxID=3137370 RepID=A0AAN0MDU3_9RHOB